MNSSPGISPKCVQGEGGGQKIRKLVVSYPSGDPVKHSGPQVLQSLHVPGLLSIFLRDPGVECVKDKTPFLLSLCRDIGAPCSFSLVSFSNVLKEKIFGGHWIDGEGLWREGGWLGLREGRGERGERDRESKWDQMSYPFWIDVK